MEERHVIESRVSLRQNIYFIAALFTAVVAFLFNSWNGFLWTLFVVTALVSAFTMFKPLKKNINIHRKGKSLRISIFAIQYNSFSSRFPLGEITLSNFYLLPLHTVQIITRRILFKLATFLMSFFLVAVRKPLKGHITVVKCKHYANHVSLKKQSISRDKNKLKNNIKKSAIFDMVLCFDM